jgi:alpha-D-ribose 1-methylphosphonate 5-triphosphate diphosphatase PhnM
MASKFFNSIKSAFVTEIPDENPAIDVNTSTPVSTPVSTPKIVMPASIQVPGVIEGQVNDELLQKLCQVMEDSNLPGPDYLELKNVANNDDMKRTVPDEAQRLMVAFITMKSSNPDMTKERVIKSIDEYVGMMENERKTGHEQLQYIWNEKVDSQKILVENAEKRIAELQKELQEQIAFVQSKNNEIAAASNECNINKANFDATVDFLVKNLSDDKVKLNQILN